MTVFLVEDDVNIRELVAYTLKAAGFEVREFGDAETLYAALKAGPAPELFLLDIMLPGEDGLSILKHLRGCEETAALPVMMLTARGEEYDKVLGLDAGADDYLAKPFGMMEMVSRVRVLLRRSGGQLRPEHGERLCCGPLELDGQQRQVRESGAKVNLTLKEFELLQFLMRRPGVVMTRDVLLDQVWGYSYEGGTRTVDVHVRSLRQKLGDSAAYIETVRGVGYKLANAD